MTTDAKTGRFLPADPKAYFYARFAIDADTGCWNWTAGLFQNGYSYFKCKALGKPMTGARASWMIHKDVKLGRWEFVCHKCDNPRCVNPHHLFVGTPKANVHDMMHKDRISWGVSRPASKLDENAVRAIRLAYKRGDTYQEIAERYDVNKTCIFKVLKGESWRRVA